MQLIALAIVTAIVFASVFLWGIAIQRWRAGQALLPVTSRPPVPWGLLDLVCGMLIWVFCNLGAAWIARTVLNIPSHVDLESLPPASQKLALLAFGAASLVTCCLIVLTVWLHHRATFEELGWSPRHLGSDIVLGTKAFAMLAPVVYAMQMLLTQFVDSKHPLIELLRKTPDYGYFATAAFAAVIVAPIAEEFIFRVLLQGWIERLFVDESESAVGLVFGRRIQTMLMAASTPDAVENSSTAAIAAANAAQPFNPYAMAIAENTSPLPTPTVQPRWWPIVISSLLFALAHWSHGPDPIPLFVFAMGLGYLYQRTGRIVPCIVLHLLLNFCSLMALALAVE